MSLTPEAVNDFRTAFPRAVHLAGYGNTLFGVVMEVADGHRLALDYFPLGDRVHFHVVDWPTMATFKQPGRPAFVIEDTLVEWSFIASMRAACSSASWSATRRNKCRRAPKPSRWAATPMACATPWYSQAGRTTARGAVLTCPENQLGPRLQSKCLEWKMRPDERVRVSVRAVITSTMSER